MDQICVNQGDLDERSRQVQLMRDIYSGADRTLIWLGEYERHQHGDVFVLLDSIWSACQASRNANTDSTKVQEMQLEKYNSAEWSQLQAFINRPWFSRVWNIQEVVLSRRSPLSLAGEVNFDWDLFADALQWLHQSRGSQFLQRQIREIFPGRQIIDVTRAHHRAERDLSAVWHLESLLGQIWALKTTDSRDYVYGFLGIVVDSDAALVPDYTKPDIQVFAEVTKYCIHQSGRLDLLHKAGWTRDARYSQNLSTKERNIQPTWLPHWNSNGFNALRRRKVARYNTGTNATATYEASNYNAAQGHKAEMKASLNNVELVLRGLLVDTIVWRFMPREDQALGIDGSAVQASGTFAWRS